MRKFYGESVAAARYSQWECRNKKFEAYPARLRSPMQAVRKRPTEPGPLESPSTKVSAFGDEGKESFGRLSCRTWRRRSCASGTWATSSVDDVLLFSGVSGGVIGFRTWFDDAITSCNSTKTGSLVPSVLGTLSASLECTLRSTCA
jgi:hypothetical protein